MCRWETRRAAAEEVSSRAQLKLEMRAKPGGRRDGGTEGRELLHQSRHTGVKKKQKKQAWCKVGSSESHEEAAEVLEAAAAAAAASTLP